MRSRLLPLYVVGQLVALATFLLAPHGSWLQIVWQVVVGWTAAAMVFVGARRHRPEGVLAWYMFGLGVFLNASGILVEHVLQVSFGVFGNPNLSDAFFLGLYVLLTAGLAYLVYRRSAGEDMWSVLLGTTLCALITLVLAIFAWEFVVWSNTDRTLTFAQRLIWTAYPLADLMVIAFVLRLLFAGGGRNPALAMVVAAVICLLVADVGWAVILRSGVSPPELTRKLLLMASLGAYALLGAAALHPSVRDIVPSWPAEGPVRLTRVAWAALAICALTAPTALVVHALLDRAYALSTF